MNYKNNIPLNMKRFRMPVEYLDNFSISTFKKAKLKRESFLIPKDYFKSIQPDVIHQKIYFGKIKYLKNFIYKTSSVAAIFILILLGYNQNKVDNEIKHDDILNYVNEDIIELSTYDFIDLVDKNDLDFSEYINYSDIENYFIENTNTEIIIYE